MKIVWTLALKSVALPLCSLPHPYVHPASYEPEEILGRKHVVNHADSLDRKSFFADSSLGSKQEIAEDLTEAKYDGQSRQKTKIDGLVYISCVEE